MGHKMRRGKGRKMRRQPAGGRKGARFVEGTLSVVRPGAAQLRTEEGTFLVARGGLREGMNGDVVRASLARRGAGELQAFVQSVVCRATTTFLGTYSVLEPLGVVVPLDERIRRDFFVVPEDTSADRLGVVDGDIVVARILTYPTRKEAGVVTLDRRVGSATELDMNVEAVVASFGLPSAFPDAVLAEASSLKVDVDEALACDPARRDLRDVVCFTIDPTDARDFDDAVSARKLADGGFEVGVHIADVSHYVAWGSSIDLEARQRSCSAYLVDRVVPMLPEVLCNDICSLVPDDDRLAMTVVMQLDRSGEVCLAEVCSSAIRSRVRLDYDTADKLLSGELDSLPAAGENESAVLEALQVLDEVSRLRQRIRRARGAIDFEGVEAKVILDAEGHPTGVSVRRRTPATQLIEEAMLIANESVACLLAEREAPCAFRVHEQPSSEALKPAVAILREMRLAEGALGERLVAADPQATQEVLEAVRGTNAEYLASQLLLRAQKRAIYMPHNLGHYALGASAYCHFTSPIRRYPDVTVHRALKAMLAGELSGRQAASWEHEMPQICTTCSERERVADAAGRASQKVKMAELYASHVGESFSGVVTGVERYGLFVMLDDTCAEGLLPVRAMGDDWYAFDPERLTLTGESTGKVWRLGMRVAVTVAATKPARGQIDFVPASSGSSAPDDQARARKGIH